VIQIFKDKTTKFDIIDKDECDFKVIFVLLFFWNFIAHVDSTHIVLLNAKKAKRLAVPLLRYRGSNLPTLSQRSCVT